MILLIFLSLGIYFGITNSTCNNCDSNAPYYGGSQGFGGFDAGYGSFGMGGSGGFGTGGVGGLGLGGIGSGGFGGLGGTGFNANLGTKPPLLGGGFGTAGDFNAFGSSGSGYGSFSPGFGSNLYSSSGYSGSGGCPPPEVVMQMLDRGDEAGALPIIQRCADRYYTSRPLLSKIAQFKGILSGFLGGGRCNNILPEYLEVIASDGGDEIVEVFRTNCPPSIFDSIKHKFKGKLRQMGGEIKYGVGRLRRGAHELGQDIKYGAQIIKDDISRGVQGMASVFEDLRSMNDFKQFGSHRHECATLTPEQIYNSPNGFFKMMSRQCFIDLSPDCMSSIPPPQIPRIKWWKYANAEKMAALPPESLMYVPFARLGKRELRLSETKNFFERQDGFGGFEAGGIEDHPCLGIGEEQEEFLMRDRKVWRSYVQRCKAGTGPSKILIIILMMAFMLLLLGLLTVSIFF
jgi:hypothetical protein